MSKLALIVVFCTLSSLAVAQITPPDQAPKRSKVCKVNEPFVPAGGVALATTITMNNDGNACWYIRRSSVGGRNIGVPMHVTRQPTHGNIEIAVLGNGTRIAYKPNAGFVGNDEFSIVNEMYNVDRPYKVIVSK